MYVAGRHVAHWPDSHLLWDAQTLPHVPQLLSSLKKSLHTPEQHPMMVLAVEAGHAAPQLPQLAASMARLLHVGLGLVRPAHAGAEALHGG